MAARRSYGTGSLFERADSAGRETWYGQWHSNGRRVKRRIGPKRADGARDGLTRSQAEAELRRLMAEVTVDPVAGERLDVAEVTRRYLIHAERRGRKASTRKNVESESRVHLAPFFRLTVTGRHPVARRARLRRGARAQGPVAEVDQERDRDPVGVVQLRAVASAPLGDTEPVRGDRPARGP